MPFPQVKHPGNGVQNTFTFSFPYLLRAHVKVLLDNIYTTDFSFVNDTTIQYTGSPVPQTGSVLTIQRETPVEPLTNFTDGSVISEVDLDRIAVQGSYVAEEAAMAAANALGLTAADVWDAESKRIINGVDPVGNQDVATKAYVDAGLSGVGSLPGITAENEGQQLTVVSGEAAWRPADARDNLFLDPAFSAIKLQLPPVNQFSGQVSQVDPVLSSTLNGIDWLCVSGADATAGTIEAKMLDVGWGWGSAPKRVIINDNVVSSGDISASDVLAWMTPITYGDAGDALGWSPADLDMSDAQPLTVSFDLDWDPGSKLPLDTYTISVFMQSGDAAVRIVKPLTVTRGESRYEVTFEAPTIKLSMERTKLGLSENSPFRHSPITMFGITLCAGSNCTTSGTTWSQTALGAYGHSTMDNAFVTVDQTNVKIANIKAEIGSTASEFVAPTLAESNEDVARYTQVFHPVAVADGTRTVMRELSDVPKDPDAFWTGTGASKQQTILWNSWFSPAVDVVWNVTAGGTINISSQAAFGFLGYRWRTDVPTLASAGTAGDYLAVSVCYWMDLRDLFRLPEDEVTPV